MDSGAIVVQKSVPILPDDTEDTLRKRIQESEYKAFPLALEYLVTGKVTLKDGTVKYNF